MELADEYDLYYFKSSKFNCIALDKKKVYEYVYMNGGEEFEFEWDVVCTESNNYDDSHIMARYADVSGCGVAMPDDDLVVFPKSVVEEYFINNVDIKYEDYDNYDHSKDDDNGILKANDGFKFYNVEIIFVANLDDDDDDDDDDE